MLGLLVIGFLIEWFSPLGFSVTANPNCIWAEIRQDCTRLSTSCPPPPPAQAGVTQLATAMPYLPTVHEELVVVLTAQHARAAEAAADLKALRRAEQRGTVSSNGQHSTAQHRAGGSRGQLRG